MGERREKRKKNNKSYQEFQTSQPPKIVGGCNCDTYVATSESILQPPVATPGCGFSQPKKNQVATKFLQPPSPVINSNNETETANSVTIRGLNSMKIKRLRITLVSRWCIPSHQTTWRKLNSNRDFIFK
jgi:hypothetical protein